MNKDEAEPLLVINACLRNMKDSVKKAKVRVLKRDRIRTKQRRGSKKGMRDDNRLIIEVMEVREV